MGHYYIVLLFLCFYLLYVIVEEMFQNYLDEFGLDKTQSLTIGKNNFTFVHMSMFIVPILI